MIVQLANFMLTIPERRANFFPYIKSERKAITNIGTTSVAFALQVIASKKSEPFQTRL